MEGCKPIACGKPKAPKNPNVPNADKVLVFPKKEAVRCNQGYSVNGNAKGKKNFKVQCLKNGQFKFDYKECKPVKCGKVGQQENGVIQGLTKLSFGETTEVQCVEGHYYGARDKKVDKPPDSILIKEKAVC